MASLFKKWKRAWEQALTLGASSDRAKKLAIHHKKNYAKHHTAINQIGGAVSGVVLGPVGPAAFAAVEAQNQYQELINARDAATSQYAENPLSFDQDTNVGGSLFLGGSRGLLIPMVLAFLVIIYILFKD
ncbi:MAG: hypothetical protein KAV87_51635 [Desulfobacteraceae bacterium]|nr:hypothetical protein [Desulfobacteraceae bacterium]